MTESSDDLDVALARLAGRVGHPALAQLDYAVLQRIAADRRPAGGATRLGLAAVAAALAAGAMGGGMSVAMAQPAPSSLPSLGQGEALAPSHLLATTR